MIQRSKGITASRAKQVKKKKNNKGISKYNESSGMSRHRKKENKLKERGVHEKP